MSENEKAAAQSSQALPDTTEVVAIPADVYMRRQQAAELMEFKRSGVKLDEAKRPGGYYIGVDGKPHDAEGRPIAE